MKRILITGANSYIGRAFSQYIGQFSGKYAVDSISLRGEGWKRADFSLYDAILHTVGLAHVKETKRNRILYCITKSTGTWR